VFADRGWRCVDYLNSHRIPGGPRSVRDPFPVRGAQKFFPPLARTQITGEHCNVSEEVIVVRRATVVDAEEIGEAHASAWEVAYVDLFDPDDLRQAAADRRRMWHHILADSGFDFTGFLVAEQGGRVVGYSHFGRSGEEADRGEIFGFYLHPAAWGKGAAAHLMTSSLIEMSLNSLEPIVVWTHPGATRAHAFYAKSGFRATGRSRTAVLGSGIDAPEVEFLRVSAT
jgi:RimJ/RimL family protein N-acetyltransferase